MQCKARGELINPFSLPECMLSGSLALRSKAYNLIFLIKYHCFVPKSRILKLLKSVLKEKAGWNEVVRSGAIGGLSKMKTSPDALQLILEYTAAGVPQPLRLAAIRALGAIST